MPQADWNQRLEGTGNGGFAGKISYGALAEGLRSGYAVTNTDMGMATPAGATASIFANRPGAVDRLGIPGHARNDFGGQTGGARLLRARCQAGLLRRLFHRGRAGADGVSTIPG